MTNDEAGWTEIRIRQPLDEFAKYGPTIEVSVSAIEGNEAVKVLAQIDTGAAGTGISKRLAQKLALQQIGKGAVHQPGLPEITAPYFRVKLSFPSIEIESDVVGLITLDPPHDILIGRDILANSRMIVDFTKGVTLVQFKNS